MMKKNQTIAIEPINQPPSAMTQVVAEAWRQVITAGAISLLVAVGLAWWYRWLPSEAAIIAALFLVIIVIMRLWPAVVWLMERQASVDIDGDGVIGEPVDVDDLPLRPVTSTSGDKTAVSAVFYRDGLTETQWRKVAVACIEKGANVSRDGIRQGGLGQRPANTAAKLLRQSNLAQGTELTRAGSVWLQSLLPHPTEDKK